MATGSYTAKISEGVCESAQPQIPPVAPSLSYSVDTAHRTTWGTHDRAPQDLTTLRV